MKLGRRLFINITLLVAVVVIGLLFVLNDRYPELPGGALAVIALVAITAGAAPAILIAYTTARPVEELRDMAREMSKGRPVRPMWFKGSEEVTALALALSEVSEQFERTRDEARAGELLVAALAESLNEGIIAIDVQQRVVRINEEARQLLRIKDSVPFSTDYLPRDRTLRDALSAAMRGEEALPVEARIEGRMVSVTANPLATGGAVLALYDVTPFRKLEAVRRDFVANVSHELRTPLTVIRGFIETLQDEDIPPELRQQFLGMASGNVQRMQRIVDDLLDLSRIESGGWMPHANDIELREVMAEVLAPLQAAAEGRGVALNITLAANAQSAFVDATAVRQVLSNLAENALRHTSTGFVELFSIRDDSGIWLGVRDSGTGIPAEHLPRIFERFYRADPSRSREGGGTGLGLSIVKHLAESHGGKIRAESTVGTGTTIAAWFPERTSAP
jgi:two-component system phosphate regulon sensor histidine kinase PhoR